jgi:hypothetical protein
VRSTNCDAGGLVGSAIGTKLIVVLSFNDIFAFNPPQFFFRIPLALGRVAIDAGVITSSVTIALRERVLLRAKRVVSGFSAISPPERKTVFPN